MAFRFGFSVLCIVTLFKIRTMACCGITEVRAREGACVRACARINNAHYIVRAHLSLIVWQFKEKPPLAAFSFSTAIIEIKVNFQFN